MPEEFFRSRFYPVDNSGFRPSVLQMLGIPKEKLPEAYRIAVKLGVPLNVGAAIVREGKTESDVAYADTDSVVWK